MVSTDVVHVESLTVLLLPGGNGHRKRQPPSRGVSLIRKVGSWEGDEGVREGVLKEWSEREERDWLGVRLKERKKQPKTQRGGVLSSRVFNFLHHYATLQEQHCDLSEFDSHAAGSLQI